MPRPSLKTSSTLTPLLRFFFQAIAAFFDLTMVAASRKALRKVLLLRYFVGTLDKSQIHSFSMSCSVGLYVSELAGLILGLSEAGQKIVGLMLSFSEGDSDGLNDEGSWVIGIPVVGANVVGGALGVDVG